jgi:predicted permease
MPTPASPPSWARRLLARTVPDELRAEVLGDLEQQYHERDSGAWLWYWRQALLYAAQFRLAACADLVADVMATFVQPGWGQDWRQARRSLTRSWAFSVTAIVILGIGLGSATAIFSIYRAILLRPFPYPSPDSLVRVDWTMPTGQSQGSSLGDMDLWTQASGSFSGLGLFSTRPVEIRGDGPAETAQMAYVSAGTLPALGVPPQIGRVFDPSETIPNGDVQKVILSDALWRRRYGQDAGVIGQSLRIGEASLQIVGVMPPGFDFPDRAELWAPAENTWMTTPPSSPRRATVRMYGVVGRLTAGVTPRQARDALGAVAHAAVQQEPQALPRVRSLRESETGHLQPYLLALAGGVGCLLLICIANVSSLQLARGAARQREFATRSALGASTGRNLRIQFAESVMLAAVGAAAGSVVAIWSVNGIRSWIPVAFPSWMQLELDVTAFGFCGGLALVASVLSAVVPALRASRRDANPLLGNGRGRTDRTTFRQVLLVGEIALSVMLLVGALLLMQTLFVLQQREAGFPAGGVLTIKVSRTYGEATRLERARALPVLHERVLDRLRTLPGVTTASLSSRVPFAGGDSRTVADLHVSGAAGERFTKAAFAGLADVSPEYFRTLGIRVVRGRAFTPDDTADRPPAIIVNERAAEHLWPGLDPVGQRVSWGAPRPDNPFATVVGVVANVRSAAADEDRALNFYYPYAQYPADSIYYVLRVSVPPDSLVETARRAIQEVEPTVAVASIKSLDQWIDESLWQPRLWGRLMSLFAIVALALAAIGLYGVITYVVLQRSKEMVIRISMGATGRRVAGLMLGGMLRIVAVGVIAGLAGAVAASRVIGSMLFQTSATDLRTYLAVCAIVAATALLACTPPILRVSRVNPMSVLKND